MKKCLSGRTKFRQEKEIKKYEAMKGWIIMKRIAALMMTLVMTGALMACGSNANSGKMSESVSENVSETSASETMKTDETTGPTGTTEDIAPVGTYETPASPVLTDDIRKICEKGFAGIEGATYEPVALIGTQVVEGTNYCILFRTAPVVPDAKETYALGYLYEDLKGNVEVTDIVNSSVETNIADDEEITGGWMQPDSPEMTDEANAAFTKATESLDGVSYTPLAFLSSQVVAGTNYCIFCEKQNSSADAEKQYVVVYIYEDLQDNAEISDIAEF